MEPRARTHDVHVAVGAGAHPGGHAQAGGGAATADSGIGGGEEGRAAAVAGGCLALGDGEVNPVTAASRLDAEPYEAGGEGGDDAGVVAGEVAGVLQGPKAGVAGHVHGSAEPLQGDLGGAVAAVGAGLTEGGDREEHEVVAGGGERLPAPPPGGGVAGREILHDDVGLGGKRADLLSVGGVGHVEDAGALVGVQMEKAAGALGVGFIAGEGAEGAEGAATRGFELEDVGAVVGEQLGGVGTGDLAGEIEDADSSERSSHALPRAHDTRLRGRRAGA